MNENGSPFSGIKSASKRLAKSALDLGENRLQLLLLELEEERDKVLKAMMLGVSIFAFGLLAGIAFTIAIVLAFWEHPLWAASILTVIYAGIALFLNSRLTHLRKDWVSFSASVSQLQKDVSCLTEVLR